MKDTATIRAAVFFVLVISCLLPGGGKAFADGREVQVFASVKDGRGNPVKGVTVCAFPPGTKPKCIGGKGPAGLGTTDQSGSVHFEFHTYEMMPFAMTIRYFRGTGVGKWIFTNGMLPPVKLPAGVRGTPTPVNLNITVSD